MGANSIKYLSNQVLMRFLKVFYPQPVPLCIDLGVAIFETTFVANSGLRFLINDLKLDQSLWLTPYHE